MEYFVWFIHILFQLARLTYLIQHLKGDWVTKHGEPKQRDAEKTERAEETFVFCFLSYSFLSRRGLNWKPGPVCKHRPGFFPGAGGSLVTRG